MIEKLKQINFKDKKVIMVLAIFFFLFLMLILVLFDSNGNEKLSENFENALKENTEVKEQGFIPPKLDNPFNNEANTTNKDANTSKKPKENPKEQDKSAIASYAKDKNELEAEASIKELPNTNLNQEEAIREIAKTQRPKDMIEFLKEKQKDIEILASKNLFKYELKEYKVGDKFLEWFEIESITKNFIRFKDKDYAYNLRFIGD